MAERTSYPPGTFSWAELVTSDADAAKAFYAQLFAWEYDDTPIGDGQVYTMATRDGGTVAALCAWEPRASIGATLVNQPGAMTWNDLLTADPAASAEFYGTVFGWTTEEI